MPEEAIVEGGRTWRVGAYDTLTIDVPAGTRLMSVGDVSEGRNSGDPDVRRVVTVYDIESGSWFTVDTWTAQVVAREIVTPPTPPGVGTSPRDVLAVFDVIAASARLLPPE